MLVALDALLLLYFRRVGLVFRPVPGCCLQRVRGPLACLGGLRCWGDLDFPGAEERLCRDVGPPKRSQAALEPVCRPVPGVELVEMARLVCPVRHLGVMAFPDEPEPRSGGQGLLLDVSVHQAEAVLQCERRFVVFAHRPDGLILMLDEGLDAQVLVSALAQLVWLQLWVCQPILVCLPAAWQLSEVWRWAAAWRQLAVWQQAGVCQPTPVCLLVVWLDPWA